MGVQTDIRTDNFCSRKRLSDKQWHMMNTAYTSEQFLSDTNVN